MVSTKDVNDDEITAQEDEDDAGSSGSSGGSLWSSKFVDWLSSDKEHQELKSLSEDALFHQRMAIKAKGYKVTALESINKYRDAIRNIGPDNDLNAGGSNVAPHPDLPDANGIIDTIVVPDSEIINGRAAANNELKNKLKARLAAKFGMGSNMSIQAMEEEYKKRMKQRMAPKIGEPEPRYRARSAPKPSPFS